MANKFMMWVILVVISSAMVMAITPDPGHDPSEIGPGTFAPGNFTFQNGVTILEDLHAGRLFGPIDWSWINNSPIQTYTTDETYTVIDGGLGYWDSTNQVAGINVVPGSESHQITFSVNTEWNNMTATLTTGNYNPTLGFTEVHSDTILPESLSWSTKLRYNGNDYIVWNFVNRTEIGIRGNYTGPNALTLINPEYKQAVYLGVNGERTDEKGIAFSTNGAWDWAMYVPDGSNASQLCFQSNQFSNIMCMDNAGNLQVNGQLTANSVNFPKYSGFRIVPTVTDNGDGSITTSAGEVNCYSSNSYAGTLTSYPIGPITTGIGGVPALVSDINELNYVVVDCDNGNPTYTVLHDTGLIVGSPRYVILATILRTDDPTLGNTLHIQLNTNYGIAKPEYAYNRITDTQGYAISSKSTLTISLSGLDVSIGGFDVWAGYTLYHIPATNPATIGVFLYPIGMGNNSDTIWNYTLSNPAQYNNQQYSNGTGLVPYTAGYYGIVDVWRGVEDKNMLYMAAMDTEYLNMLQAEAETRLAPVPVTTPGNAVFIGRIIFQENNVSNSEVKLHSSSSFSSAIPNQNHNSLSGIQGGSGGAYFHLGLSDYTSVLNKDWLGINTTANIQSLGFLDSIQSDAKYLQLGDQRYNESVAISNLDSTTLKNSGAQNLVGSLNISGQATIGGGFPNGGTTMTPVGDVWMSGSLYLLGNISSVNVGQISINGSYSPVLDNTFNLGDPTHRWSNIYVANPPWLPTAGGTMTGNITTNSAVSYTTNGVVNTYANGCSQIANSTGMYWVC